MRADGVVRARGLCWKPPGASAYALEKIDLELRRGECALLTGPSGSGKSSLLRALAGLLRDGRGEGVLELARAARPDRLDAGLLLQNPDTQLLCATVGDELRLGLEALGLPDASVEARLREVRDALELSGIERRNVERLSAGQKQRVALGAVLALQPDLLLLDEPTAQLDAAEVARLVELLGVLKRSGHAILIAEHLPGPFRRLADRWLRIENGVLREEFGPPPETESRRWPEVAPGELVLRSGSGAASAFTSSAPMARARPRCSAPAPDSSRSNAGPFACSISSTRCPSSSRVASASWRRIRSGSSSRSGSTRRWA
jgi:energy-coupling factor transport system ATP-binding protein